MWPHFVCNGHLPPPPPSPPFHSIMCHRVATFHCYIYLWPLPFPSCGNLLSAPSSPPPPPPPPPPPRLPNIQQRYIITLSTLTANYGSTTVFVGVAILLKSLREDSSAHCVPLVIIGESLLLCSVEISRWEGV